MSDAERSEDTGRARDLASLALLAGGMGLFDWHLGNGQVIGDEVHAELFGTQADAPYSADRVFEAIHPDDREMVEREIARALEVDGEDYDTSFRVVVNGRTRWLGGRGRVVERSASGEPLRMLGVNWDRTEAEEQEYALEFLAREMNHRINNAFAVIEALLALGGRVAQSVPDFAQTLRAQVHALADTHKLMVGETLHDHAHIVEVPIDDLVRTALREWLDAKADLIELELDQLFVVPPNRIAGMAMLLYELSTNSRRYGVLGPAKGRVQVLVDVEGDRCRLTWRESFEGEVPPGPSKMDRETFGAALLHHCTNVLNAVIERNERMEDGFEFVISLPIVDEDGEPPRTLRAKDLERLGIPIGRKGAGVAVENAISRAVPLKRD